MVSNERPAKQRFLVAYDYGQGGVWAFIWARTEADIRRAFRDLEVVDSPPAWMSSHDLAVIEERMTFNIDNVKTDDWIARLLRTG
jgi:hypothetical protein